VGGQVKQPTQRKARRLAGLIASMFDLIEYGELSQEKPGRLFKK
jgi:hypothetical protein